MHMKNITLSAQEDAIERARAVAARKHRTLNDLFREWLESLANDSVQDDPVAERLQGIWQKNRFRVGRKLTREEMNGR